MDDFPIVSYSERPIILDPKGTIIDPEALDLIRVLAVKIEEHQVNEDAALANPQMQFNETQSFPQREWLTWKLSHIDGLHNLSDILTLNTLRVATELPLPAHYRPPSWFGSNTLINLIRTMMDISEEYRIHRLFGGFHSSINSERFYRVELPHRLLHNLEWKQTASFYPVFDILLAARDFNCDQDRINFLDQLNGFVGCSISTPDPTLIENLSFRRNDQDVTCIPVTDLKAFVQTRLRYSEGSLLKEIAQATRRHSLNHILEFRINGEAAFWTVTDENLRQRTPGSDKPCRTGYHPIMYSLTNSIGSRIGAHRRLLKGFEQF